MKKHLKFIIPITFVVILILFFVCKTVKHKITYSFPKIKVACNNKNIENTVGEFNWFNGAEGNTSFREPVKNLIENINALPVKKGDTIKFEIKTHWKQPTKTTVKLIKLKDSIPEGFEIIKQFSSVDKFTVPSENGEHIFIIKPYWDKTHSVEYIFKINVILDPYEK